MAGIALASLSGLFNGSWSLTIKLERVAKFQPPTMIFNFYFCLGYLTSSFLPVLVLLASGHPFEFNIMGFCAGVIMTFGNLLAFAAIQLSGVALASGIFCSVSTLVGFIWGIVILRQSYRSLIGSLLGVAIVIVAIIIMLNASRFQPKGKDSEHDGGKLGIKMPLSSRPRRESKVETISRASLGLADVIDEIDYRGVPVALVCGVVGECLPTIRIHRFISYSCLTFSQGEVIWRRATIQA